MQGWSNRAPAARLFGVPKRGKWAKGERRGGPVRRNAKTGSTGHREEPEKITPATVSLRGFLWIGRRAEGILSD
jgi:hypothetical protein